MAQVFKQYTGIQIGNDDMDDPAERAELDLINLGGLRIMGHMINATDCARRCQQAKAMTPPKFVVFFLGGPGGYVESPAQIAARVKPVIQACDPYVDAWEMGNEPATGAFGHAADVGGTYWTWMRNVATEIQKWSSKPRLCAAPFSNPGSWVSFSNGNQTSINEGWNFHDFIEGFCIHPYANGQRASGAVWNGGGLSGGHMEHTRLVVDGFAGARSWSDLPMYCTECGWSVRNIKNPSLAHPPGDELGTHEANITVSNNLKEFFELCRDHRQDLKLRFAGYFIWRDYSAQGDIGAAFDGLKKEPTWPTSMSTAGSNATYGAPRRQAYTVLRDQVPRGYDLGAAITKPTVITDAAVPQQTTAGLQGRINPNGDGTTRYFVWGRTSGGPYTSRSTAPDPNIGSGNSLVNVGFIATGLAPNTTYYYRAHGVNGGGDAAGAEVSFKTLASGGGAPAVVTGPATLVDDTSGVLNGTVNPNGQTVTDWHFEWGLVAGSYPNSTPFGTIAAGSNPVPVSFRVTGLPSGKTVFFRLSATNATGTTKGLPGNFVVKKSVSASEPELTHITPIPLVLEIEIVGRDGQAYRLSVDAPLENRPLNIACATQAGDGFAEASFELARDIEFRWPDLDLLNPIRFLAADGESAYEGRISGLPRVVDEDGVAIQVQCSGPMSSAKDRPFTEVIVDRSTEGWQPASLPLRKAYMAADTVLDDDYQAEVDSGSILFKGKTNKKINGSSQAVLEYFAPTGAKIRRWAYKGTERNRNGSGNNVSPARLHGANRDDQVMGDWPEAIDLNLDGTVRAVTLVQPRSILGLRMRAAGVHGDSANPSLPAKRRYDQSAVYGAHGVPLRANGDEPEGVYASDVIAWIVGMYCPTLNADGVEPTSFVIEHLVFDQPTAPFDAFTLVNGFHLWSLGAWENGTVTFRPFDLTDSDWLVRHSDAGTTLDIQGDAVDSLANGIIVSYTDTDQRDQDLTPDRYADLRDLDPDNPANKAGIDLWTTIEITEPVTQKGALAIGRVALAEFNRPKAPGTIRVGSGYVKDVQGNLQPGHRVRCGQTIAIQDLPYDKPRLITSTAWSEDGTLEITVERPEVSTEAVLARLQQQYEGRG